MAPRVGSSATILDYRSTKATPNNATTNLPSMNTVSASSASTVATSNNHHIRNTLRETIPNQGNPDDIDYANSIVVQNIVASNFRDNSSQHVGSVLRKQVGLLAGKTAKRRLNELRNTSRLPRAQHDFLSEHEEHHDHEDAYFDNLHKPLRLSWDEIFVEDMLGMGGFGSVCLVTCPKLRKQREREQRKAAEALQRRQTSGALVPGHESFSNHEDVSMNASFAMTADDSSFGGSMMLSYASTTTATGYEKPLDPNKYYACKSLSNKTIRQQNVRGFVQAAADLVHEAFLLSHINPHPNLVRLYGIPSGEIETAFCGNEDEVGGSDLGYFLVLEALGGGILSEKIVEWKQQHSRLIREQNILRKRREQQLHNQRIPAPPGNNPNSPSLRSFLGSPVEQRKSHAGKRTGQRRGSANSDGLGSITNSVLNDPELADAGSLALFQNYQIPTIEERLDIALQIASGMQHLHHHGVIFRDLKPHNVGLSITHRSPMSTASVAASNEAIASGGMAATTTSNEAIAPGSMVGEQPQSLTWRLFDFGLAREVPVSARNTGSPRTMIGGANGGVASDPSVVYGKAGSLRYMAPETMGGRWLRSAKHQNSSCFATFGSDVYSYAILIWELIGLQNFDRKYDTSPEDFESAVCDRGHRPGMEALDKVIDEMDVATGDESEVEATARIQRKMNIRELVHACWREDYRQRPTFDFIVDTLRTMFPKYLEASESNHTETEDESDLFEDNTVATDNLDASMNASSLPPHLQQHPKAPLAPIEYLSSEQVLRMSNHSYKSHSQRSGASRRLKKSNRSFSSRSMMSAQSAQSMSTHSMVLEDVFELETEHSHSTGSRSQKRSDHKYDLDDDLDDEDIDEDDDNDEMANDASMTDLMNADLLNESVITVENKSPGSSRYLNYNGDYNDENNGGDDLDDNNRKPRSEKSTYGKLKKSSSTMPLDDSSSPSTPKSKSKKITRPKSTSSLGKKKKKKNRKSSKSSHAAVNY